jgi:hypothetical protein
MEGGKEGRKEGRKEGTKERAKGGRYGSISIFSVWYTTCYLVYHMLSIDMLFTL